MEQLKRSLASTIAAAARLSEQEVLKLFETPPEEALGDIAFPCFALAKTWRKPPVQIAQELAAQLSLPQGFARAEAAGPYLNLFFDAQHLLRVLIDRTYAQGEAYGSSKGGGERVVIEYAQPNTNKPLHIGHLRNILLGSSLARILAFRGREVRQVNINNDRGVHICKSMLAYQRWGEGREPNKKSDHFVGDFYVLFSKMAKEDPALEEQAQELLRRWEEGDAAVVALWRTMNRWALEGFAETFKRLNIRFDREYYESEIYKAGRKRVLDALERGVFVKDESGAIYAPLEKVGLPDKFLLRKDGTSLYMTQDLHLAHQYHDDFAMDRLVYVVASEQDLYFKQLFATLKMIGFPAPEGLFHLSYGMVNLPEGKMKSREGTVVDADDLLDDMERLAREEVRRRHDVGEDEAGRRARAIAHGAIRFFMLKYDTPKDITFLPEASLSFEGETGPYVQYTHARICSIFRKMPPPEQAPAQLRCSHAAEARLAKSLLRFEEVAEEAAREYRPELVARYAFTLAQQLTTFYHECPVIQADEPERASRLVLLRASQQVLANALGLLGIEAPEEM